MLTLNIRLQRAAYGLSICKPLSGGTRVQEMPPRVASSGREVPKKQYAIDPEEIRATKALAGHNSFEESGR